MFSFGRMLFLGLSSYTCQCSLLHLIFFSHFCNRSKPFLQFLFCLMRACNSGHSVSVHLCSTCVAVQWCGRTCSMAAQFPPELVWLQCHGGIKGLCSCPWLLPGAGSAASRGSWACATTSHLAPFYKFYFLGLLLNSAQHPAPEALLVPPTGNFSLPCQLREALWSETDVPSEIVPME